jgi:hypothetical protein
MGTFNQIDYKGMSDDKFKHLYIDSIVNDNTVWGCIPEPAFDRACRMLADLGFTKIDIERVINDPEAIQTYVVSSTKNV